MHMSAFNKALFWRGNPHAVQYHLHAKDHRFFFSVKNFQLSTLMIPILLTPGAADFVMISNKQKDF